MFQITRAEMEILVEFCNELDLLIEEDDGTFFTSAHLAKVQELKEVCYAIADRE